MKKKTALSVLALDSAPEEREMLYLYWDERLTDAKSRFRFQLEVSTNFSQALSQIVKGRYSIVFCPLLAAAQDIAREIHGWDLEKAVSIQNPAYHGRFLFYATPEVLEWAQQEERLPGEREILLWNMRDPDLDAADRAVERTLARVSQLQKKAIE